MKKLIILSILTILVIFLSCQKDENKEEIIPQEYTELRNAKKIFYDSTFSTSNKQLATQSGFLPTQEVFIKDSTLNAVLTRIPGAPIYTLDNTTCSDYNIIINYTNGSSDTLLDHRARYKGTNYTVTPSIDFLKRNARKTTIVETSGTETYFDWWVTGKERKRNLYFIKDDNNPVVKEFIQSTTTGQAFVLKHKFKK